MLRKLMEILFPGFTIEHGFVPWDVGDAVGIGASLLGGAMGDDAAGDAADAQMGMSKEALAELKKIDDRTRYDTGPYRNFGERSLGKLSWLLGTTPKNGGGSGDMLYSLDDWKAATHEAYKQQGISEDGADYWATQAYNRYMADPAWRQNPGAQAIDVIVPLSSVAGGGGNYQGTDSEYGSLLRDFTKGDLAKDVVYNTGLQFGLDEGNKALDRRSSALGNWDSGATLKALTRYGNDYATTKAGDAWGRFMKNKASIYDMLSGGVGVGQWGVGTSAASGNNYAQGASGLMTGMGNAQAAGIMGGANSWGNAISGVANSGVWDKFSWDDIGV